MVDLTEEEHAAITARLKHMGALMGVFGRDVRLYVKPELGAAMWILLLLQQAVQLGILTNQVRRT